ncbi:hypothetical protein FHS83_003516 [Rhizomicrobium palustre]|uniref:Uncharacterized protein n=1 Tax=Rhizomicrobium palustre TaxID=189966 RepID=A0A846N2P6_9PROT|nr:hypothetical protein [Rhizomicrobium palustre]
MGLRGGGRGYLYVRRLCGVHQQRQPHATAPPRDLPFPRRQNHIRCLPRRKHCASSGLDHALDVGSAGPKCK